MKIRLISDAHLEFYLDRPQTSGRYRFGWDPGVIPADVFVLAGDIVPLKLVEDKNNQYKGAFIDWLADRCESCQHVIEIPGNHSYYGGNFLEYQKRLPEFEAKINARAKEKGYTGTYHFGDRYTFTHDNVKFICATTWTDFKKADPFVLLRAPHIMNDYAKIKFHKKRLMPSQILDEHNLSVEFIKKEIEDTQLNIKIVLVTHHLLSEQSIHESYIGDEDNYFYFSNLENLLEKADFHFHGHTHISRDFKIDKCRVVCNPHGYFDENEEFNPELVIEI